MSLQYMFMNVSRAANALTDAMEQHKKQQYSLRNIAQITEIITLLEQKQGRLSQYLKELAEAIDRIQDKNDSEVKKFEETLTELEELQGQAEGLIDKFHGRLKRQGVLQERFLGNSDISNSLVPEDETEEEREEREAIVQSTLELYEEINERKRQLASHGVYPPCDAPLTPEHILRILRIELLEFEKKYVETVNRGLMDLQKTHGEGYYVSYSQIICRNIRKLYSFVKEKLL